jgi:cysteine desulfurase
MTTRVYLDWNATTPLRPQARAAMLAAFDASGNPSSIHAEGRTARRMVEDARAHVAALTGAKPANVTFTSGGTEANALALSPEWGIAGQAGFGRLLISAVEHPSVRAAGRFPADAVDILPVDQNGALDLDAAQVQIAACAARGERVFVSVMAANNETGVVQPIRELAQAVHEKGGLLHVDAVQAAGKISININKLECDLLSISAHKIGGPKGVGALIRRDDALHLADPIVKGGGQERGLRGGTENVIGIAGFGAAAAAAHAALASEGSRLAGLRDAMEAELRAATPGIVIFGAGAERLPNTMLAALPGMKAETAVIAFDLEGVALSSGSACSSGKVQASHVLASMGVPDDLARGSLRVSLGWETSESHVKSFIATWIKLAGTLTRGLHGMAA